MSSDIIVMPWEWCIQHAIFIPNCGEYILVYPKLSDFEESILVCLKLSHYGEFILVYPTLSHYGESILVYATLSHYGESIPVCLKRWTSSIIATFVDVNSILLCKFV